MDDMKENVSIKKKYEVPIQSILPKKDICFIIVECVFRTAYVYLR